MASEFKYTLGLDLGVGSIGFAIVELDGKGEPCRIERLGVRRFPAGADGDITRGRDESHAIARRNARSMRRQLWRRRRRDKMPCLTTPSSTILFKPQLLRVRNRV